MQHNSTKENHHLEIALIIVCIALTALLYAMQGYKMVILNMFFLPIALSGFFLGRYRTGVMALLCVIAASCVTAVQLADLAPPASPLVVALAVSVWAAVLGLTALLVGSLSDDRNKKVTELHDAYVGVVEVLSQYLQNSQPNVKTRSIRVGELSQKIAMQMKMPPRQIDDIRVTALLHGMGNIEITTKAIRRAVGTIEDDALDDKTHTFRGADLITSLGSVLSGAVPLLLSLDEHISTGDDLGADEMHDETPLGAKIIRASRAYCTLLDTAEGVARFDPHEVIKEFLREYAADTDPAVIDALKKVVLQGKQASALSVEDTLGADSETPEVVGATPMTEA